MSSRVAQGHKNVKMRQISMNLIKLTRPSLTHVRFILINTVHSMSAVNRSGIVSYHTSNIVQNIDLPTKCCFDLPYLLGTIFRRWSLNSSYCKHVVLKRNHNLLLKLLTVSRERSIHVKRESFAVVMYCSIMQFNPFFLKLENRQM